MEDAAIVALYWQRNEAAITETDRKYGRYCRRIAQNILASAEDAEECVSDTWLSAWNTMPPQRPSSLPPFLGRIVRNFSLSRWRRTHAQKRGGGLDALLSELEDCLPAPGSVADTVETRALTGCIEGWLEGLPKPDRLLFLRRYWYGEPVNALAAQRGETPNRTAKRLLALRRGLKKILEGEGAAL